MVNSLTFKQVVKNRLQVLLSNETFKLVHDALIKHVSNFNIAAT